MDSKIKEFLDNQLVKLKNAKLGTKEKLVDDTLGYLRTKYQNINCKCQ